MIQMGMDPHSTPVMLARREYITQDPETIDMLKSAQILAPLSAPVTILGPTGTGKELIAKILHGDRGWISGTKVDNFKAINCSGIVPTLFESIVFGHVRGAFTGAINDSTGMLRAAGTGTVFFDEIGDLPLDQQAKLLRVLQDRRVCRVGDTSEVPIACRFVFATNKDLKAMVKAGTFREDLYYRITTAILRTKNLVNRQGDAELIARSICQREKWTPVDEVPVEAYKDGNVRQLYNWLFCVEHGIMPDL